MTVRGADVRSSFQQAVVMAGLALLAQVASSQPASAQLISQQNVQQLAQPPAPAARAVYLDAQGVIRWKDDRKEVALFGANYILPSASDYRAAGYLGLDRKRMITDDMAHFARMGWDGMRLTLWGDWENADHDGNLITNDHLDLFDYLIFRARERGVYMLLSPIQTYSANWPDALADTTPPGFSNFYKKDELGTNPKAIEAQARYISQLLEHVNPYTGVKIKDEPAILFIEMINEPTHHANDLQGSIRYINALVDAVRRTGCTKLLFHNVSQDFAIAEAIKQSKVDGVSFGWYPTGLNSGHELQGNYLRTVDDYDRMRSPVLAGRPRIVYEFDSPDLRTGYMYPAMTRAFRSVGTQFAAMFAYDMLGTASRNLGWQTHYLNLVYTPRKAISAVIAAEAMRRLPPGQSYGPYPANARFGDFRVSYEENLAELVATDAFMNAGTTRTVPPSPSQLQRVAGYGSSPVVSYEGEGVYFLDRLRQGVWRLEVYPDAVPVRDPFEMMRADKIVTRAIARRWPMQVVLPDLGETFAVSKIAGGPSLNPNATRGRFDVTPGVYILSAGGPVARATLPAWVSRVGLAEYHAPPGDTMSPVVESLAAGEYLTGRPLAFHARVVTTNAPDAVTLSLRALDWERFWTMPMTRTSAYEYRAQIPDSLREGVYEYAISVATGSSVSTFPGAVSRSPASWDFASGEFWHLHVVRPTTPITLFEPARDAPRMAFTRIGDGGRRGIYQVVLSSVTGQPAFHFEMPRIRDYPIEDYTASLVVSDRIATRTSGLAGAALVVRARGLSANQTLTVTLTEHDGTSWSAPFVFDSTWTEKEVALSAFAPARGVTLPVGYPGIWNYWVTPSSDRGGAGESMPIAAIERLLLSLREGSAATGMPNGVEVESIRLRVR